MEANQLAMYSCSQDVVPRTNKLVVRIGCEPSISGSQCKRRNHWATLAHSNAEMTLSTFGNRRCCTVWKKRWWVLSCKTLQCQEECQWPFWFKSGQWWYKLSLINGSSSQRRPYIKSSFSYICNNCAQNIPWFCQKGSNSWKISRFQWQEETMSMTSSPWMGIAGLPPAVCPKSPFLHLKEKGWHEVSCLRKQHDNRMRSPNADIPNWSPRC